MSRQHGRVTADPEAGSDHDAFIGAFCHLGHAAILEHRDVVGS
jgi:hypothetical protein